MTRHTSYEVRDSVGFLTFKGTSKANALTGPILREMISLLDAVEYDPLSKVIILKPDEGMFCTGSDLAYINYLQSCSYEENLEDALAAKELFEKIYRLKKVVIAQVSGHAVGGGCGLAAVCDFSFAAPDALLGYPEVKIGFIPAVLHMFLIRKIGESKARELMLTGDLVSAEEGVRMGLINKVIENEKLEEEVFAFARKLCREASASSLAVTKRMIADMQKENIEKELILAARTNASVRMSPACRLGINAYVNKEKLEWDAYENSNPDLKSYPIPDEKDPVYLGTLVSLERRRRKSRAS